MRTAAKWLFVHVAHARGNEVARSALGHPRLPLEGLRCGMMGRFASAFGSGAKFFLTHVQRSFIVEIGKKMVSAWIAEERHAGNHLGLVALLHHRVEAAV